ncbi:MAG: ATP-binding protein, partial [Candidatus Gastranaerophilales bacterium]|nr:ATP-binding protein [Candidatus Gastranaerophilales bacterium]
MFLSKIQNSIIGFLNDRNLNCILISLIIFASILVLIAYLGQCVNINMLSFLLLFLATIFYFFLFKIKSQKSKIDVATGKILNEILISKNYQKVLNKITKIISELFHVQKVAIRFYDEKVGCFSPIIGEYCTNENNPPFVFNDIEPNKIEEKNIFLRFCIKDRIFFADKTKKDMTFDVYEIDVNGNKTLVEKSDAFNLYIKNKRKDARIILFPLFYENNKLGTIIFADSNIRLIRLKRNIAKFQPFIKQLEIGINNIVSVKRLRTALKNEVILKELIENLNREDSIKEIKTYLQQKLESIFKNQKVFFIQIHNGKTVFVRNGFKEILLEENIYQRIKDNIKNNLFLINNVREEIKYDDIKNFLIYQNIESFISYFDVENIEHHRNQFFDGMIVVGGVHKQWSAQEINFFKILMESIKYICLEIKQKKELEETRKTFIAALSHDLKTPILATQKAIEFFMTKENKTIKEIKPYLEDINSTNDELLRLINNLTLIYRDDMVLYRLNKKFCDIEKITKESIAPLQYLAKNKNSEIIINNFDEIPQFKADCGEIKRVMMNIVENAIKHTDPGTKVEINCQRKENELMLSVKDNGQGVSAEDKEKIFEKFYTTKLRKGT